MRASCLALLAVLSLGCFDAKPGGDTRPGAGAQGPGGTGADGQEDGLAGSLSVSASALDFARVTVGDTETQVLTVTNDGSASVGIEAVTLSGEAAFSVVLLDDALLVPGASVELAVSFSPEQIAPVEAALHIETTSPDADPAPVWLEGQGRGAVPTLEGALDFGAVPLGCEEVLLTRLANTGTAPFTLAAVEANPPFSVVPSAPLPAEVDAAGSLRVAVTYTPEPGVETDAGTLTFVTTAGDVSLDLWGSPDSSDRVTDTHTVGVDAVDILVSVDRSTGMWGTVEALQDALPGFFAALTDLGHDWRLAFVAADDGCVDGPDLFLDGGFSGTDAAAAAETMIGMGTAYGSNMERGFMLLDAATDATRGGGCNAGLLRSSASLNLVSISDEPDQSVHSHSHYVSRFQSLKANPDDVVFHAVGVDGASTCASGSSGGYAAAATATGGTFLDICDPMEANLAALAEVLRTASRAAVPLSTPPVEETLAVEVDGVTETDWAYDSDNQRVVFGEGAEPDAGSEVTVDYVAEGCR